jgi:gas vesicle protein
MAERDDFGAFLLGFVVGGLTGAIVALLMAPQSGEETRAQIRDKTIELKDIVSDSAEEAYARAEAAAADARTRAEEWAQIAKVRAEELQRRGAVVLEEQRSRLGSAIESAKKVGGKRNESVEGETPAEG